jgi:hypothetical protein
MARFYKILGEIMSTKIYYAVKLPTNKLMEFIKYAKDFHVQMAGLHIVKMMNKFEEDKVKQIKELMEKHYGTKTSIEEKDVRFALAFHVSQEQKNSMVKTPYDIACGITGWIKDEYAYMMFYGVHYLDKMELPDYAKEYGYWNNTDQPDEVTDEEWDERHDTWYYFLDNYDRYRIYHQFIDYSNLNLDTELYNCINSTQRVSPYFLLQIIKEKENLNLADFCNII